jgi:hypothetical protein
MNRWHQQLLKKPHMINDFDQPHDLVGVYLNEKVEVQGLANHKETQELVEEKTPNPQGGSYGTTLRTRALGFSIFMTTSRG